MEPEPKKHLCTYEPDLGTRFAWYFGINGIPIILCLIGGPIMFAVYPVGLAQAFLLGSKGGISTTQWAIWLSCGFYVLHFILTFAVPYKGFFKAMIIILIVAVILNLTGCAMMWNNVSQIH